MNKTEGRESLLDSKYQLDQLAQMNDYFQALSKMTHQKALTLANGDGKELQDRITKGKKEEQLTFLSLEVAMGIINRPLRRQVIRSRMMTRIVEEKELSSRNQKKNEDFMHYISSRRQIMQQEIDYAFMSGPKSMLELGDKLSKYSDSLVKSFASECRGLRLKESIFNFPCHQNDILSYLADEYTLLPPKAVLPVILSADRLQFALTDNTIKSCEGQWVTFYLNHAVGSVRYQQKKIDIIKTAIVAISKPIIKQAVYQIIANTITLLHPKFRMFAHITLNPQAAPSIIRRRLSYIGYPVAEDAPELTTEECRAILRTMLERFTTGYRYYFEMTVPKSTQWKVGFARSQIANEGNVLRDQQDGCIISSTGYLIYEDQEYKYTDESQGPGYLMGSATYGFILDKLNGSVSMISVGTKKAFKLFGLHSDVFKGELVEKQILDLRDNAIKIFFSLPVVKQQDEYADKPYIKVNFGNQKFVLENIKDVRPLNQALKKSNEDASSFQVDPKPPQANPSFKAVLKLPPNIIPKSFSQFPPSAHRKLLSASIIQRAWRRFHGKRVRTDLFLRQTKAALIIQATIRGRLAKSRAHRNRAAFIIQRNWRKNMYIWVALIRLKYRKPLKVLHYSATKIQRAWRSFYSDKNSPFAVSFRTRLKTIIDAINKIINWWRKIRLTRGQGAVTARKSVAAVTIQKVYRGYRFRKRLRDDIRQRFRRIGESILAHRNDLIKIHAVYTIQKAWKAYQSRKVSQLNIVAKTQAATKIQALWRGHIARMNTGAHLNYAEGIFLRGVFKSLKACHFILKMYTPCGIVCPPKKRTF